MPLHQGLPPGLMTARQAIKALGIAPATFYKHYADLPDSWQISRRATSRLYTEQGIALLRAWINLRAGFQALGLPQTSEPANSPNWRGYVEGGEYDDVCPTCHSESAVTDYPQTNRVWCPVCRKIYNEPQ